MDECGFRETGKGIGRMNTKPSNMGIAVPIAKTSKDNRSEEIGNLIHADTWGLAQVKGINGSHYFVLFIDDYSRITVLYLLKTKEASEVLEKFKTFEGLMKHNMECRSSVFTATEGANSKMKNSTIISALRALEEPLPRTIPLNIMGL